MKKEYIDFTIYKHKILYPIFTDNSIDTYNNTYLNKYEQYYNAFQNINKQFSDTLLEFIESKDLIMIHDIGLTLVPIYFMKKSIYAKIGIFLHACFPSSDVFKVFPKSKDILNSILLCDEIGFHIYKNARNFLAVLNREFGINYEIQKNGYITISYLGRTIIINISHVGIDKEIVINMTKEKDYSEYLDYYKKIINNRYCITSIDNLNETLVFKVKLDAFYEYLNKYPDMKNKIFLYQIIKGSQIYKKSEDAKMVYDTIDKIKKEFGENVIYVEDYDELNNLNYTRILSLFSLTNLLLVMQTTRGFSTIVNEFMLMNENNKNFGIIISENLSVSPSIKNVFRINPYNRKQLVKKMEIIINKKYFNYELFLKDMKYVNNTSTYQWIYNFFNDLKKITANIKDYERMDVGIGFDLRILQIDYYT